MPGTIQVSVLDLLDLPPSSISVKVSMGKKEHQVWDKGEFSFPLTTLSDNLILTLYDIEGNELSRTVGVNTKLVVEKGFWDDLFPLEGGGHLHMKLQFVLSAEERKRIREMRESALRKKQEELLIKSERGLEAAAVASVGHNILAAFNHVVTDSRENLVQSEAVSNGPENREEIRLERMTANKTDGKERTPAEAESLQEHKIPRLTAKPWQDHLSEATQQIVKKTNTQLPPNGVLARPISSEGSNNETEGTSSAPIPKQEHKFLTKLNNQTLPYDITTRPSSSQNQTHNTIKQIALERFTRNDEADGEGTSSDAASLVRAKFNFLSPPHDVTTRSNSLHDQTHNTIKQIGLETPRNNETDREGTSSEATRQISVNTDTPSPADHISTKPSSSRNRTDSTIKQISLMNIPRNNDTDREGTSSVAKLSQDLQGFHHTTAPHVMEKTVIQSRPYALPTRFIYSKGAIGSSTVLVDEKSVSSSSPLEENQTRRAGSQTALEKAPSNVRKMISAFETSLPQGPLPRANATKLKPHLSKLKTEVSLEDPSINEVKMENSEKKKQIVERELNPYSLRKPLVVNLHESVPHLNKVKTEISLMGTSINETKMETTETMKQVIEKELNIYSISKPLEVNVQPNIKYVIAHTQVGCGQLEELDARSPAVEGNKTSGQIDCNIQQKKENVNRPEMLLEETATVSGRVLDDPVRKEHTHPMQETFGAAAKLPISQTSRQLELLDGSPAVVEGYISSSEQVDCNLQYKKEDMNRQETLLEELVVSSEAATAIVSGRILYDPGSKGPTHTVPTEQQGSALDVLEECARRNSGDVSEKINTSGISREEWKSLECLGDEQSHSELMRNWILPDERRRLCITAGSKQMVDFAGCFDICGTSNQMETSLSSIGDEKEVATDNDSAVKRTETETISHDLKDDRVSGGLVGQAIRIAIMVAFGTLVVVTRQTRNR